MVAAEAPFARWCHPASSPWPMVEAPCKASDGGAGNVGEQLQLRNETQDIGPHTFCKQTCDPGLGYEWTMDAWFWAVCPWMLTKGKDNQSDAEAANVLNPGFLLAQGRWDDIGVHMWQLKASLTSGIWTASNAFTLARLLEKNSRVCRWAFNAFRGKDTRFGAAWSCRLQYRYRGFFSVVRIPTYRGKRSCTVVVQAFSEAKLWLGRASSYMESCGQLCC